MERENVLARFDIAFRDPLGHEAFKDCGIVHYALAIARVIERFSLHFGLSHLDKSVSVASAPPERSSQSSYDSPAPYVSRQQSDIDIVLNYIRRGRLLMQQGNFRRLCTGFV